MTEEMKYLPSKWQDEVIPAPQADVNTFICPAEAGQWEMLPVENRDDPEDATFYRQTLEPGTIIAFDVHRNFGDFQLHVYGDGTHQVDGDYPSSANCFVVDGDIDTLQDNLETLVKGDGTQWAEPLQPGDYDLQVYWWSEKPSHFRFTVDEGRARFEPCEGPN
ncbi:MAG TPA: hypothetical protein VFY63_16960 [Pseudorhizobium sp.]|nr:hypothetical protein [Pseudorhizobium sp.]